MTNALTHLLRLLGQLYRRFSRCPTAAKLYSPTSHRLVTYIALAQHSGSRIFSNLHYVVKPAKVKNTILNPEK
jgi:hypothetical protein